MSLNLPVPLQGSAAATWKRLLEAADVQNVKVGRDVVFRTNRLILVDSAGQQWSVTVSTSGTLQTSGV